MRAICEESRRDFSSMRMAVMTESVDGLSLEDMRMVERTEYEGGSDMIMAAATIESSRGWPSEERMNAFCRMVLS